MNVEIPQLLHRHKMMRVLFLTTSLGKMGLLPCEVVKKRNFIISSIVLSNSATTRKRRTLVGMPLLVGETVSFDRAIVLPDPQENSCQGR